ncbi:hypothetical protein HPB51_011688 [Rhipicephalus microplus]|uniref:Uncharacterized protein n=1 Tax=Rhipicephalus microplus TaxID=6941 RepID=A0A6M2CN94_RHIMP|nr:hypothetical protein HPB51_011688 [Rhipicephalus microplus]
MAFMMPVVRNDYDIYNRSRRSSPDHSNIGSPLGSTSLSTSPNVHGSGEDVRKMYRTHEHLDTLGPHRPRSGSLTSLKKFHHLLVDTLKRAAHHNSHAHMATGASHSASGCSSSGEAKEQADCDDEQDHIKEEEKSK